MKPDGAPSFPPVMCAVEAPRPQGNSGRSEVARRVLLIARCARVYSCSYNSSGLRSISLDPN